MIEEWKTGGATRQAGGNWAGRFILPDDLAAWYVTNGRYLEQGQMATVGDALLKWDGSAFKIIDATFADQPTADAWIAKVGAPISANSTATITGTLVRYGGVGVGWVAVVQSDTVRSAMEDFAVIDAWVPTTAYYLGSIVQNNGNVWVCQTILGGISGAVFPSATPAAAWVVDGTVSWAYLRDVALIPSGIASTAIEYSLPTTTTAQTWRNAITDNTFGGIIDLPRGFAGNGVWGGIKTAGEACALDLETNAKQIKFAFTSYGFQSPGIYVKPVNSDLWVRVPFNGVTTNTGSGKTFVINFASRVYKRIRIFWPKDTYDFAGIGHDKYAVFRKTKNYRETMLLIGDSFTAGSNYHPGSVFCSIPSAIRRVLDIDVHVNALGGSGYVAGGENKFYNRLIALNLTNIDTIAFAGGINDSQGASFTSELAACYDYVRSTGKRLVVFGAFYGAAAPSTVAPKDAELKAACEARGGTFVPVAAMVEPVLTGLGNVGTPANDGTGDLLRSIDGTHPVMLGSLSIGEGMALEYLRKTGPG